MDARGGLIKGGLIKAEPPKCAMLELKLLRFLEKPIRLQREGSSGCAPALKEARKELDAPHDFQCFSGPVPLA
jgi:hypothetical protein